MAMATFRMNPKTGSMEQVGVGTQNYQDAIRRATDEQNARPGSVGGTTWAPMGQMQDGQYFGGVTGGHGGPMSSGMGGHGGGSATGGTGAAPAAPGRIGYRGSLQSSNPYMGGLQDFYAARTKDPLTGLTLNPSANEIMQNQARMQGAFGASPDFAKLGLTNAYYQARNAKDPFGVMAAGQGLRSLNVGRNVINKMAGMAQSTGLNQSTNAPSSPTIPSPMGMMNPVLGGAMAAASPFGGEISMRAHGGPVHKVNPYLVGEEGPEIYVPKKGNPEVIGAGGPEIRTFKEKGTIIPNHKIKPAADGDDNVKPSTMEKISMGLTGKNLEQTRADAQASRDAHPFVANALDQTKALGKKAGSEISTFDKYKSLNPLAWPEMITSWASRKFLPEKAPIRKGYELAKKAEEYIPAIAAYPFTGEFGPQSPEPEGETGDEENAYYPPPTPAEPEPLKPSMFANRQRGFDDSMALTPGPAFLGESPADKAARGIYPSKPQNPYLQMPVQQQLLMAMNDYNKHGIESRGDDGSVTFRGGGGIMVGPNGQKVAYGPHVVNTQPQVQFTPGHVRDEVGDMSRFNSPTQVAKAPIQPQAIAPTGLMTQKANETANSALALIEKLKNPNAYNTGRELEDELGIAHVKPAVQSTEPVASLTPTPNSPLEGSDKFTEMMMKSTDPTQWLGDKRGMGDVLKSRGSMPYPKPHAVEDPTQWLADKPGLGDVMKRRGSEPYPTPHGVAQALPKTFQFTGDGSSNAVQTTPGYPGMIARNPYINDQRSSIRNRYAIENAMEKNANRR